MLWEYHEGMGRKDNIQKKGPRRALIGITLSAGRQPATA